MGTGYAPALVITPGLTRATPPPCAVTLHNLFKRVDIAQAETVLSPWGVQPLQSLPVFRLDLHSLWVARRLAAVPGTPPR